MKIDKIKLTLASDLRRVDNHHPKFTHRHTRCFDCGDCVIFEVTYIRHAGGEEKPDKNGVITVPTGPDHRMINHLFTPIPDIEPSNRSMLNMRVKSAIGETSLNELIWAVKLAHKLFGDEVPRT